MPHLKLVPKGIAPPPKEPGELQKRVNLRVVKKGEPPVSQTEDGQDRPKMSGERFRGDFLEASHALLQAHSLIDISQESYIDPESENIYNLLGVLDEKIQQAQKFFDEHDLCWGEEAL